MAEIYQTAVNHAQRAEIVSRVLVYEYGGVWIDADFQCLKNIEELIDDCDIFCGEETHGGLSAGIWGATPKHPLIKLVLDDIEPSILRQRKEKKTQNHGAGPHILRRLWSGRNDEIRIFPPEVFYPYLWTQKDPGEYGDAYAVHHWAATWKD